MSEKETKNRYIVVVGALLMQLALGALYCFGSFQTYVVGFLLRGDPNITYAQFGFVYAASLLSFAVTMIFSGNLAQKIGPRKTGMIGGVIIGLSLIINGFMTTFAGMFVFYGIFYGIGIGLAYVCPISTAAKWFPDKKALINGISVAGFGFASVIFIQVGKMFVNPENLSPSVVVGAAKYYDSSLTLLDNVPALFMLLGVVFLIMIIGGSLTLENPPEGYKPEGWEPPAIVKNVDGTEVKTDYTRKEAVKTPEFWTVFVIFTFSLTAGLFTIGNYKTFGQTSDVFGTDVAFFALVASLASLLNGLGRLFWGAVAQKIGFKLTNMVMFGIQAIFMLTLPFSIGLGAMFAIWICVIYFQFGGSLSLCPTSTQESFGSKYLGPIYGLMFMSYGIGGVSGQILGSTLGVQFGFSNVFITMGIMSIISVLLMFFYKTPLEKKQAVAK
ncbi:MAG: OFA family MFS transporter [archaeon]|nr:OFA family MFS transporter [archaeon]